MNVSPRYHLIRRELIDMVYDTAFSPSPTEPMPPPKLFGQLRPTLELCSLWGLLKRLYILDPANNLVHRVEMYEILSSASRGVRPARTEKIVFSAEEEERFRGYDQQVQQAFGEPVEYPEDSTVLHFKSVSLIMSLAIEDLEDPEGRDRERRAENGIDVIAFVDAFLHGRHTVTSSFVNWSRLKEAARLFDQMIEVEIASS